MDEREKQRATHLILLLGYSFFVAVLTAESFLLGWGYKGVVEMLIALTVCWWLHITEKASVDVRQKVYYVMSMVTFIYYGIHETSVYDMAPVMISIIVIYYAAEIYDFLYLCVAVYFLTMSYNLIFVSGKKLGFDALLVSRTLLHYATVFLAGYLLRLAVRRNAKEKKQAEERIQGLEEINRRTEDFLTNVSHELRTPINVVIGLTSVLLKDEKDEGKRQDIFSIQQAGERLFGQIEDILDFTEIDTGRIKISKDAYMFSSLVNDIITSNRLSERTDLPEIIFDIDAGMPSVLIGDGRKLKKIINHLLDNAVKFTKEGGVYIKISALRRPYGINLCIQVSDTGIGIDEEGLEKIKEKFYQSNSGRNRRAGGLGLGFPIVHGLVAAMEGFMQIESRVDGGTDVFISIPQKTSDDAPSMAVADKNGLCIACYLKPEKYKALRVREFYDEMISNLAAGLDVAFHRAYDMDGLEMLLSRYQLTHIFLGKEEYEENSSYFENLDLLIQVVVIADSSFTPKKNSRTWLLRKPFYGFQVLSILDAKPFEDAEDGSEKYLLCPDVRALVVDDEPMNLMVAEGILGNYGMQVTTAHSGMEAIGLCQQEMFDLIFLDHMMPGMDGVETLHQIRKQQTDLDKKFVVIAFTANAVSGAKEMFLSEGFDEFISKPIENTELERVLKKTLPKSAYRFADEAAYAKMKEERDKKRRTAADTAKEAEQKAAGETGGGAEDPAERLKAIGVHTEAGLAYCQDDMEFYQEMLGQYVEDAEEKAAGMEQFYAQEDWANYQIIVHALKSTSKMIGVDDVSEMAKEAEGAAKSSDADYIHAHHGELLDVYRNKVRQISEILGDAGAGAESVDEENLSAVSAEELVAKLAELKDVLVTFEVTRAEMLLAEMNEMAYRGEPVRGMLHEIADDVEDLEYDMACEKAVALIERIKGGEA